MLTLKSVTRLEVSLFCILLKSRSFVTITTTSIDIILTLVTPYCMYYPAEHFHYSGVLAVVSGGLFLSRKRHQMLNYRSRIEGVNVWTNFVFVLNGLIFLLIGLQLPSVTKQLGEISLGRAVGQELAVSFVLLITRLLCTDGAALFTRFMSRFVTVADANPGWKGPLIFDWAGMRGVMSLAAALSIPLFISTGHPFPYRNLILFITFIIIPVTLVFQGLTLPWLLRKLALEDKDNTLPLEKQEFIIQKNLAQYSLQYFDEKYSDGEPQNEYLNNLQTRLKTELVYFSKQFEETNGTDNALADHQQLSLEVLEHQRNLLQQMNRHREFDEELIRKGV